MTEQEIYDRVKQLAQDAEHVAPMAAIVLFALAGAMALEDGSDRVLAVIAAKMSTDALERLEAQNN